MSNNIVNSSTDYLSIEKGFLKVLKIKNKIRSIFNKKNTSYNISKEIIRFLNKPKKIKNFMKLIKQTYIIAEAGVNHNGSMRYAKKLTV